MTRQIYGRMPKPRDFERFMYEEPGHYCVRQCFIDYSRERLIAKGKDCMRAWMGFNNFMDIVPPQQDITKLTTGQVEDFVDYRMTTCTSLLTPKRELTFVRAAIKYAHRRNRIGTEPYFEIPDAQCRFRRPMTEEEFRLVMSKPMSKRLRYYYWVAYYTGHRPKAIEELKWDRVDFVKLTIDFNVPGRAITNKRRARDFPIVPDFLRRLEAWKAAAKDEYVIGAGYSTWKEANYVVRELCGIKDTSLVPRHCMRKMFATALFEKRADPEVVGKLLADDPNTLRAHYVKFKDETLRAAAALRVAP